MKRWLKKCSVIEKSAALKFKINFVRHIYGSMPNVSNQIWSNVWKKKAILEKMSIIKLNPS